MSGFVGDVINSVTGGFAKDAAGAQIEGIQQGIGYSKEFLNYFKDLLQPYFDAGGNALEKYSKAVIDGDYSDFYTSPGYEFTLAEGKKAIENTAATKGGVQGGNVLKALTEFGQGLASSEYQNYLQNLGFLTKTGQTAINQYGSAAVPVTTGISSMFSDIGEVAASGIVGKSNTINNWISQAGQAAGYFGKPA